MSARLRIRCRRLVCLVYSIYPMDEHPDASQRSNGAALARRVAALVGHLARIHARIANYADMGEIVSALCEATVSGGEYERAGILLFEERRGEFVDMGYWDASGTAHNGGSAVQCPSSGPECVCAALIRGDETVLHCDSMCRLPFCPLTEQHENAACVVASLRMGDRLIGLIWGQRERDGTEEDSSSANILAHWSAVLAGTLEHARLLHENRRRLLLAAQLARVGAATAAESNINEVLRLARDGIVDAGILDRVAIFLREPGEDRFLGSWGTTREGEIEDLSERIIRIGASPKDSLYQIVYGDMPFLLTDDYSAAENLPPGHRMYGVRSHCTLPLRAGKEIVGIIVGDNLLTDRRITEEDVALLLPVSEQVAVAVVNARLHSELTRARESLAEEVRVRTADLEDLSAEMSAFVHTLSHDLRSPVRAVEAFIYSALHYAPAALPLEVRRDLERAHASTDRMGQLIEALLALARLGRRRLNLETVHPDEIAAQALSSIRSSYSHGVDVRILPMPTALADAEMLRIVYGELLDNAMRATRGATLARIEVGYSDGSYYVSDNGIGFEQQYVHALFDLFRGSQGGSEQLGAGLAIVRRVIGMHGGAVWAEGVVGEGAVFRFTIGETRGAPPANAHTVVSHAAEQG